MGRRWKGIAAVLVLVLVAGACGGGGGGSGGSGGSGGGSASGDDLGALGTRVERTPYGRVVSDVDPDGHYSLDTALALFAMAYGALPGTDPAPAAGQDIPDGTLAIDAVVGHWDALDDGQRAAFRDALDLPASWEPGGAPVTGSSGRSVAPSVFAAFDDGGLAAYRRSLDQVQRVLTRHLGNAPFEVTLERIAGCTRVPGAEEDGCVFADALLLSSAGPCRVRVYPDALPVPSGPSQTLAHELFHCYQQAWDLSPTLPVWVEEGTAEWVGAAAVVEAGGATDAAFLGRVYEWINTPGTKLFERSYDAAIWFAHVDATGPTLWDRLRPLVERGHDNETAYGLAIAGASDAYLQTWPSAQTWIVPFGREWFIDRPYLPGSSRPGDYSHHTVGNGGIEHAQAPAVATGRRPLRVVADLMTVEVTGPGDGTVHNDDGSRRLATLTEGPLCTGPSGRCVCPRRSRRAGETFPRFDGDPLVVTVTGGLEAASVTVRGISLEDYCERQPACAVGRWVVIVRQTATVETVDGGTGAILTVGEDGAVALDFTPESEWHTRPRPGGRAAGEYWTKFNGVATGRVVIPGDDAEDIFPVTLTDVSFAAVTGTSRGFISDGTVELEVATRPITLEEIDPTLTIDGCQGNRMQLGNGAVRMLLARRFTNA